MSLADRLRAAIQDVVDAEGQGEGWSVAQFVVVMGLERVVDGGIQASAWYWHPPDHADWMVTGLLECGIEMRAGAEADD